MSIEQLQGDIKLKNFRHIYLICGEEDYLKRYYKNELVKAAVPEEERAVNLLFREGASLEPSELNDYLGGMPMFAQRRLLIIQDLPLKSEACDYLIKNSAMLNLYNIILIYNITEQYDRRLKQFTELEGVIKENGLIVTVDRLSDSLLPKWIAKQFSLRGKKISISNINYIISSADRSMEALYHEIEKLSSYSDGQEITKDNIDLLLTKTDDARAYVFAEAILDKDRKTAAETASLLLRQKTPEQVIAASVYNAVCNIYKVKLLSDSGLTAAQTVKETGIKEFIVKRYSAKLRQLSATGLEKALKLCVEADTAMKTSQIDNGACIAELMAGIISIL